MTSRLSFSIPGVGDKTMKRLISAGFDTAEKIAIARSMPCPKSRASARRRLSGFSRRRAAKPAPPESEESAV